jgi:hypothetical protein
MKRYKVYWLPTIRSRKLREAIVYAIDDLQAMTRARVKLGDIYIVNALEVE